MQLRAADEELSIYEIFERKLFGQLKSVINAYIDVKIDKDNDILTVYLSRGPVAFTLEYPQIGAQLLSGNPINEFSNRVVEDYKKKILGLFFYSEPRRW